MVTAYRVPATYRSINMWGAVVSGIFLAYQLFITSFAQIPITGEGMTGLFFSPLDSGGNNQRGVFSRVCT